jgi:hypothetical protein
MAITVDVANAGTNFNNSTTTTITVDTTSAIAVGGFIVVSIGWFDPSNVAPLSTLSGGGLSWTIDKQGRLAGGGFGPSEAIISAQAPAGLASGTTLTGTFAASMGNQTCEIGVSSFLGVKTSSPVDGTPTGPTNNASGATWVTSSYSIAAGSVLYAAANCGDTPTNTQTAGTEAYEVHSTFTGLWGSYRIESSAGSYTLGGNLSGAAQCDNVAVAYLAAPTGVDTGLAWIRA